MPNPRIVKVNTVSFENEFNWRWSRYHQDTNPNQAYVSGTLDFASTQQTETYQNEVDELIESYNGSEIRTTCLDFQSLAMPVYLSSLGSLNFCGSYKSKFVFTAHHPELYITAPPVYSASSSAVWHSQKPFNFSYREFFRKLSKDKYNSSHQGFKFSSNTGFENLLIESTLTQKLHQNEHFQPIEGAEIKVWLPKAFTSGASPLELTYKSVSQAKLNRTAGAIVPVLVPVIIKDRTSTVATEEEAYFYTFLINADLEKISKYKKARQYFLLYIERFVCYSGLYYADKNAYDNMIYDNPYMRYLSPQHLAIYHSVCNDSVKASLQTEPSTLLSLEQLSPIISERVLPEDYISKKAKFQKKVQLLEQTSSTNISEPLRTIRASVTSRLSLAHEQSYKKQRITDLLDRLETTKHLLTEIEDRIQQHRLTVQSKVQELSKVLGSARSYLKAKLKFIEREKSLNLTFLDLLKSTPLEVPKTEQNLLNDFAIQSITLFFDKTDETFVLDNNTDKNVLFTYLAKQTPTIKELVFLTKTPSKIRVDGKDQDARVGGPYRVRVSSQQLSLSLAQPNSYIGIDGRYLIFHPHVSGRTSLTDFTSACLGEASPLIYAAFETNRISRIILAANTWLTSANSADTWGKRYIHFPHWSDYENYLQWQSTNKPTFIAHQEQDEPPVTITQEVAEGSEELPRDLLEEQQELPPQETVEYTRYTPR